MEDVAAEFLDPRPLERNRDDVAFPVALDVEEGVRDRDRQFVAELMGAHGVAEDHNVHRVPPQPPDAAPPAEVDED